MWNASFMPKDMQMKAMADIINVFPRDDREARREMLLTVNMQHARTGSPCLPQPLLNILQLAIYIRILPSQADVKTFGYPCHAFRRGCNRSHIP